MAEQEGQLERTSFAAAVNVGRAGTAGQRRSRLTGVLAIEEGPIALPTLVAGQQFGLRGTFLKDAREDPLDRTGNLQGGLSTLLMPRSTRGCGAAGKSLRWRPML